MSALGDWTAFFVDVGQWAVYSSIHQFRPVSKGIGLHTTVVTTADTVTPDASFTSPLLAIDKHRGY